MNYFKIKFILAKHCNIQPSEVENMPFYEIEYILENLADENKKRNERQEDEQVNHNMSKYTGDINKMKSNPFKSINTPKFKPPKF